MEVESVVMASALQILLVAESIRITDSETASLLITYSYSFWLRVQDKTNYYEKAEQGGDRENRPENTFCEPDFDARMNIGNSNQLFWLKNEPLFCSWALFSDSCFFMPLLFKDSHRIAFSNWSVGFEIFSLQACGGVRITESNRVRKRNTILGLFFMKKY